MFTTHILNLSSQDPSYMESVEFSEEKYHSYHKVRLSAAEYEHNVIIISAMIKDLLTPTTTVGFKNVQTINYLTHHNNTFGRIGDMTKYAGDLFSNVYFAIAQNNLEYIIYVSRHIDSFQNFLDRLQKRLFPSWISFSDLLARETFFVSWVQNTTDGTKYSEFWENLLNVHESNFALNRYLDEKFFVNSSISPATLSDYIMLGFSVLALVEYEKDSLKQIVSDKTDTNISKTEKPSLEMFEYFLEKDWTIFNNYVGKKTKDFCQSKLLEFAFDLVTQKRNIDKLQSLILRNSYNFGVRSMDLKSISVPWQMMCRLFEEIRENFWFFYKEDNDTKQNITPRVTMSQTRSMGHNTFNVGAQLLDECLQSIITRQFNPGGYISSIEDAITFLISILDSTCSSGTLKDYLDEIQAIFGQNILDILCKKPDDLHFNINAMHIKNYPGNPNLGLYNQKSGKLTLLCTKSITFILNTVLKRHGLSPIMFPLLIFSNVTNRSGGYGCVSDLRYGGSNKDYFTQLVLSRSISNGNLDGVNLGLANVSIFEDHNVSKQSSESTQLIKTIRLKHYFTSNTQSILPQPADINNRLVLCPNHSQFRILNLPDEKKVMMSREFGLFDPLFGSSSFYTVLPEQDEGYLGIPSYPLHQIISELDDITHKNEDSSSSRELTDRFFFKSVTEFGKSHSINPDVFRVYENHAFLTKFWSSITATLDRQIVYHYDELFRSFVSAQFIELQTCTRCMGGTCSFCPKTVVDGYYFPDTPDILRGTGKRFDNPTIFGTKDTYGYQYFGVIVYNIMKSFPDLKKKCMELPKTYHDKLLVILSGIFHSSLPSLESLINSKIVCEEYDWNSVPRNSEGEIISLSGHYNAFFSKNHILGQFGDVPKLILEFAQRNDSLLSRSIYSLKISPLPQLMKPTEYEALMKHNIKYGNGYMITGSETTVPFKLKMFEYFTSTWIETIGETCEQDYNHFSFFHGVENFLQTSPFRNLPLMFGVNQTFLFYFMVKKIYNRTKLASKKQGKTAAALRENLTKIFHEQDQILLQLCGEPDDQIFEKKFANFRQSLPDIVHGINFHTKSIMSDLGRKNMCRFKYYAKILFKNWMTSGLEKLIHIINICLLLRQYSEDSDKNNPVNAYNYDKFNVTREQTSLIERGIDNIMQPISKRLKSLAIINSNLHKNIICDNPTHMASDKNVIRLPTVMPIYHTQEERNANSLSNYLITQNGFYMSSGLPFQFLGGSRPIHSPTTEFQIPEVPKIVSIITNWKGSPFKFPNFGTSISKLRLKDDGNDTILEIESILIPKFLDSFPDLQPPCTTILKRRWSLDDDTLQLDDVNDQTDDMDIDNINPLAPTVSQKSSRMKKFVTKNNEVKVSETGTFFREVVKSNKVLNILSESSFWTLRSEFGRIGKGERGSKNPFVTTGPRTFMTFKENFSRIEPEIPHLDSFVKDMLSPSWCEEKLERPNTYIGDGDIVDSKKDSILENFDFEQHVVPYIVSLQFSEHLKKLEEDITSKGNGPQKERLLLNLKQIISEFPITMMTPPYNSDPYYEPDMVTYLVANLGLLFSNQIDNLQKFTGFRKYKAPRDTEHTLGGTPCKKQEATNFLRQMFQEEFVQNIFGGADTILLADYALKHLKNPIRQMFLEFVRSVIHKRWSCLSSDPEKQNITDAFLIASSLISDIQNVILKYSDANMFCDFSEDVKKYW